MVMYMVSASSNTVFGLIRGIFNSLRARLVGSFNNSASSGSFRTVESLIHGRMLTIRRGRTVKLALSFSLVKII